MFDDVIALEREEIFPSFQKTAIIFDLDDTLMVEKAVSDEALRESACFALKRHGVKVNQFVRDASSHAKFLWKEGSSLPYCQFIGISAFECLWGNFEGESNDLRQLRRWSQTYRVEVFDRALREQKIEDLQGAHELATTFAAARRRLQRLMPDAHETLARLSSTYQLALLTNGAPDLQREKIAASGLETFFQAVIVSGEYGIGKPRSEIFHHLTSELGVNPAEAVMVGNSLESDIAGAQNVGMTSIWIEVAGHEERAEVKPDFTIQNLAEIPAILKRLSLTYATVKSSG